jgi:hypothetical protein
LGLLATTSAFAFGAAPALAHEFIASKEGKLTGSTEAESKLRLGPFKITCLKATTTGKVAQGMTKTIATATKLKKCHTEGKIGNHPIELNTTFLTPIAVEYHAGGAVEVGSELEEEEGATVLAGGEVELKISAGSKFKCMIHWPEQTLPKKAEVEIEGEYKSATFSNETRPKTISKAFPGGLQHYIVIHNSFKLIHFEMKGEPCEEWGKEEGPEGTAGLFTAAIPTILSYGNLEFL